MAAAGFTIVYEFTYRGNPEEWSQQYHLHSATPSDAAAWDTLRGAVVDELRLCLTDVSEVVRFYGYENTDDDAVYVYDYEAHGGGLAGEFDTTDLIIAPGDAAAWQRWKTDHNNSHGKPVYCRKYWHGVPLEGETGDERDSVLASYRTALQTAADDLMGGVGPLPTIGDPQGNALPGPAATSPFVTTRTLKRRGPRPH